MPFDPSIYFTGAPANLSPAEIMHTNALTQQANMATQMQRQQGEMQRQNMAEANAFKRDIQGAGGDVKQLEGVFLKYGKPKEFSELMKSKREEDQAAAKLSQEHATFFANVGGAVLAAHKAGDTEGAQSAWDQGLFSAHKMGMDVSQFPRAYDPRAAAGAWQLGVSALERYKEESKANDPKTELAKLEADFKAGRVLEGDYFANKKKITTHGALVNIGYSQPFEVTDRRTGKSKLVQQDKSGNLREVPQYDPKGGDKAMTESQGNAFGFGVRARDAHKIMSDLEATGVDVATPFNKTVGEIPLVGNYTKSADIQKAEQAQRNFVTAVLRKESGAAINVGEFKTEAMKYFPQPGDSPDVRQQKRSARERAIEVLQVQAGRDLPEEVKKVKDAKPNATKVGTKAMLDGWMRDNPNKKRSEGVELMKANGYSVEDL